MTDLWERRATDHPRTSPDGNRIIAAGTRARKDAKIPAMESVGTLRPNPGGRGRNRGNCHHGYVRSRPCTLCDLHHANQDSRLCGRARHRGRSMRRKRRKRRPRAVGGTRRVSGPDYRADRRPGAGGDPHHRRGAPRRTRDPRPTPQATPDATGTDAIPTVEPAPVPTPDIEAGAPDAVECDTAAGRSLTTLTATGSTTSARTRHRRGSGPCGYPSADPGTHACPDTCAYPGSYCRTHCSSHPPLDEAFASAVADLPALLAAAVQQTTGYSALGGTATFSWILKTACES